MANFNKVILAGNLTRDIEIRQVGNNNTSVASCGLAVNRRFKQGEESKNETTFVDITLWGRQAEIAEAYAGKGSSVLVEGRLQTESWEDKESGQKRSKVVIVVENLQLLDKKGEVSSPYENRDAEVEQAKEVIKSSKKPKAAQIFDDDVPF